MDAPPIPARPGLLERLFRLSEHGTNVRTEVLAGVTTLLTMAYIVLINPSILAEAGMPEGAVFVATGLVTARLMPFTYSIATSVSFGFITHAVLNLLSGRAREAKPVVWVIAAMFLFKFIETGGAH